MKRFPIYLAGFLMGAIRYSLLLILAIILIIVGLAAGNICNEIGLGILGLYLLLCLISMLRMKHLLNKMPIDQDQMNAFMEMMQQGMNQNNEHALLQGEDLLTLSNEDLFEAVYEQNLAICAEAGETDQEVLLFTGARRTVFVVNIFDMEIQNGGLCQFFVNSSRSAAPYVSQALTAIGADAHRKLFDEFIETNGIDVNDLDSFKIKRIEDFQKQAKRFDFDAFDDRYYELEPLTDLVADYIRENIGQF